MKTWRVICKPWIRRRVYPLVLPLFLWSGAIPAATGVGTVDGIYVEGGTGRIVLGDRSFLVTGQTVYRDATGAEVSVDKLRLGQPVRFTYDPKTHAVQEIEPITHEEIRQRAYQP